MTSKTLLAATVATFTFGAACDAPNAAWPVPKSQQMGIVGALDVDDPSHTLHAVFVASPIPMSSASVDVASRSGFPITRATNGVVNNDAWASFGDTDTANITVNFAADYDVTDFAIWNDFGINQGQGASDLSLHFYNKLDELISSVTGLEADEANVGSRDNPTNGPDHFTFPEVQDVSRVVIEILDNFNPDTNDNFDALEIREFEFGGIASPPPPANCLDPLLDSVEIISGLTERDDTVWPISDLCDVANSTGDGYASDADEDSGVLQMNFTNPTNVDGVSIWNDFGTYSGQGVQEFSVQYFAGATSLGTFGPYLPDPANQLVYNMGDHFSHTEVSGVTAAVVTIVDNMIDPATTGVPNSLNIREIRFQEAAATASEDCTGSSVFASIVLGDGLTELNATSYPAGDMCDGVDNNDGYHSSADEESGTIELTLTAATDIYGVELFNDFGSNLTQGVLDPTLVMYDANGFYTDFTLTTSAGNQGFGNGPDALYAPDAASVIPGITRIEIVIPDNYEAGTGLPNSINIREFRLCTTFPCP